MTALKPDDRALKAYVRRELDAQLSFLDGRSSLRNEIWRQIEEKGEKKMKKKISAALVCALIALLAAATALAAGLTFSGRYDVKRAAIDALEEKYGITDEMMTLFSVEVGEMDKRGAQTVTFSSIEPNTTYGRRMGVYTVTVKGGRADAAWSLDGAQIEEGIDSPVYGAAQLQAVLDDYTGVLDHLAGLNGTQGAEAALPDLTPDPTPCPTPASDMACEQAERMRQRAQIEKSAKLTFDECRKLAVAALQEEYALTDGQCAQLWPRDDGWTLYFETEDGRKIAHIRLDLRQREDGRTEKDGIYLVDVDMDTGVVEDVLYDSGLAGNP